MDENLTNFNFLFSFSFPYLDLVENHQVCRLLKNLSKELCLCLLLRMFRKCDIVWSFQIMLLRLVWALCRDSFWRTRVVFQTKVVYQTKFIASKQDVYQVVQSGRIPRYHCIGICSHPSISSRNWLTRKVLIFLLNIKAKCKLISELLHHRDNLNSKPIPNIDYID
jgi:hypothetical protein